MFAGAEFLKNVLQKAVPLPELFLTPSSSGAEIASHILSSLYEQLDESCLLQDGEVSPCKRWARCCESFEVHELALTFFFLYADVVFLLSWKSGRGVSNTFAAICWDFTTPQHILRCLAPRRNPQ